ncbi:MAG: NADH-quinone oxidoreductase subunit L [Gemmatimonadota bacterium]|nr:NADH-quinone oxidoreductase subunit L [Gemmatimonadota bacterium]
MALASSHPLAGTIAAWMWLLPVLPLLGFVINGALSVLGSGKVGPSDPDLGHDQHDTSTVAAEQSPHAVGDDTHAHVEPKFRSLVSIVGSGVLLLSFVLAAAIFFAMRGAGMSTPFIQTYWSWMPVGDLQVNFGFQLDQLSMLMVLIITGVGTLIHIFSMGYMRDDPGYARFFAYLNLFVFFMLVLVLGASYPILFVGWEGVGLCSYLLIGFWFLDKANADAGKKAFIVNRIGDVGVLIAMFLIFANLGSLDFAGVAAAAGSLPFGGALVTTICLFLFLGCTGKSAQLPLYVWLPDAMAGPTPVSALIHAATMVTAGVYLIVRSSFLFSMSPVASITVAVVGGITALFAATIAIKQWDIKKVLAYSTISQLGYMFVGVGVGAYSAGVFHLATHAFFKALLFLGAGSVIYALHEAYHHTGSHADAQDMRNMGGLKKAMPVTWVLMWIATLAISGIPPFAGFFSKDSILGSVFEHADHSTLASATWLGMSGHTALLAVYVFGLAAAFLTAVYMTRMMLYTFHGQSRATDEEQKHLREAPWIMTGPLVVLGALSLFGGWLNLPSITSFLGPVGSLDRWLEPVVGHATIAVTNGVALETAYSTEAALVGAAILIAVVGIAIALFLLRPASLVPKAESPEEHGFEKVLANKYYVDEVYDVAIVKPTYGLSKNVLWRGLDAGIIDNLFVNGSAALARGLGWLGSRMQTGSTGVYAWAIVIGAIAVLSAFSLR